MKTESLIDLLARGAGPAPRAVAARRLLPAALLGVLLSAMLAVTATLVIVASSAAPLHAAPVAHTVAVPR